MQDDIHVCDVGTLTYLYTSRNGFKFLHRIICACGRYWTLLLRPDRYEEGKMIGFWQASPKPKPDFEDRYRFSLLTDMPWDYYEPDYDYEKPRQEMVSKPVPVNTEKLEVQDAWREFRREGGFTQWP